MVRVGVAGRVFPSLLRAEVTRGEMGRPPVGSFLWRRGDCLGEVPAGETSDPGNVNTDTSDESDQGDILGDPGRDFRDISEEIFSLHSFLMLVKLSDRGGERKVCLYKSGLECVFISTYSWSFNWLG